MRLSVLFGVPGDQQAAVRHQRLEMYSAALVLVVGLVVSIAVIDRGIWLDEFAEIYTSRRGPSFWDFLENLGEDVHPLLHYGMFYVANQVGISDIRILRLLNIFGVPLVLWAIWWAWKQERASVSSASVPGFTSSQASAIIALYASSIIFLNYLAEARSYFFVISASVAVTLVWRVMMAREGWNNGTFTRLCAWGVSLTIFVNLHYFATIFGGMLTFALLVRHAMLREWSRILLIALVGLMAATPALLMGIHQIRMQPDVDYQNLSWITTTSVEALSIYFEVLTGAVGYNIAAVAAALVATQAAVRRRRQTMRAEADGGEQNPIANEEAGAQPGRNAILSIVVVSFFALLFAWNIWHPIVIDRYLFPACGAVIVLLALAAAGPFAPRWSVFATCIVALTIQVRGALLGEFDREGWAASASAVADAIKTCPETKVYVYPFWDESRFGQSYYAERNGFSFQTVGAGDFVPRQSKCPNILWIEHIDELYNASTYALKSEQVGAQDILARLKLRTEGTTETKFVESGLLIFVR